MFGRGIMNFNSPFSQKEEASNQVQIRDEAEIVFVSDLFTEQYSGGAELTTEALISKSPVYVQKVLSKDVTVDLLEQGHQKYWIFGNFAALNHDLIPTIVANMNYSVVEYDYKYCKYRSPEKHMFAEGDPCNCEETKHGKLVSAFYYGAKSLWWMSESQHSYYTKIFPFLSEKHNSVLSSIFSDEFFVAIKKLRASHKETERKGWIVLGSNSWIKGANQAEEWCKKNGHDYEVVWGLEHYDLLEKLANAEGFVYLPMGKDTCPRMVIEAKLLGCKLELNDFVQHKDEEWFTTNDILEIEEYLYGSRDLFWRQIMCEANYTPTISGYTTTYNCIDQEYPYENCIESMLEFCDEVVVVDGGSTDGTWEALSSMSEKYEKLKIDQVVRDWTHKRFAVFDGAQKAEARKRCTKEYCWQMDADEVAVPGAREKIINFCRSWPATVDLVSLPVVEFWGSEEKVRVDVNPWKWRLSKNAPHITHGIPADLRRYDEDENLYASPGTDGCDYVHVETGERIPHATFYNDQAHHVRSHAVSGNEEALSSYEGWFQNCVDLLPSVLHYSWMDIDRKIRTYKNYWQTHWESLYDITQEDTAENNMFFDKPWADVSEKEISDLAKKLAEKTGGHVFHNKIDWEKTAPSVKVVV
jgi:glycosyltransferase involved in cell wall biosynthesis